MLISMPIFNGSIIKYMVWFINGILDMNRVAAAYYSA